MKYKMAVPRNILTMDQISRVEDVLGEGLLNVVTRNFPNWMGRAESGDISGGEIILQDTDQTKPIKGLRPGVHITISLTSFAPDRNFDRLARDVIDLVKQAREEDGSHFMAKVGVFVQMSLDCLVVKNGETGYYITSSDGKNLLEYSENVPKFRTKPT